MSFLSKRLQALALASAVAVTACTDSSGPGDGEFDANATSVELGAVDATFETPAYQSLAALGQYFETGPVAMASASAAMLKSAQAEASTSWTARALRNAPNVDVLASASAPIPRLAEHYGTQFVYDETEGHYVPNPEGEAPENGIRVILYAVNPITHEIASPLNPIGHVDIIDVNPESSAQIAVQVIVVSEDVTYTDYTVTATLGAEVGNGASINAAGYLTDGQTRADFDLTHTASYDFTGGTVSIDYHVEVADRDFAIDLAITVQGNEAQNSSDIEVRVTRGPNWVTIAGQGTNEGAVLNVKVGTGDGEGRDFATITISPTGIEVLGADGEPLSEEEAQALREIFHVVEHAFDFFDELFKPVQWIFQS
jgi:hypothetical protein